MDNYTKVREDISQALDNAQELGYHARQKCRSRVPIYDIHLRNLVIEWDNGTVGNAIPFYRAWLIGWDTANVNTCIPNMA